MRASVALFVVFACMAIFRVREYSDKSVDVQVLIKLSAISLSLIVPFGSMVAGQISLMRLIPAAWLAFLLSFLASSTYAPIVQVSFISSLAFVGCLLFSLYMTKKFGEKLVVTLVISLVGFVSILSLIVYFVYPDLGRMHAWLGDEFGTNGRITGIVGTPNGLGGISSISLMLSLFYFRNLSFWSRVGVLLSALPTSACLIMSDNRMSFGSLIICLGIYFASKGNKVVNFALAGLIALLMILIFASAPDAFMALVARSGEASEITTATGRSIIWQVVLERIADRPLMGWGYASATSILPMDPRLFYAAAHCHNLYLEVLFSGGLMSFLLFLTALIATLTAGIRHRCFEPMVLLLFFLIRGCTEPSPFGGMPTFAAYAFFLSVSFIDSRTQAAKAARDLALMQYALIQLARCRANLGKAA